MTYFEMPVFGSHLGTLFVFLIALACFHILFVWVTKLGSVEWKVVDYVWLTFGLLGVLGGVSSSRQAIAKGQIVSADIFLNAQRDWVFRTIDMGTSGGICRVFEPSKLFPDVEKIKAAQKEFDEMCEWFRSAKEKTRDGLPGEHPLRMISLNGSLPPTGADKWFPQQLDSSIARYNSAFSERERIKSDSEQSETERLIEIISPLLFAIAIALRITKTTGEIILEKEKAKSRSPEVSV